MKKTRGDEIREILKKTAMIFIPAGLFFFFDGWGSC